MRRLWTLGFTLLVLMLAGCSAPVHVPLAGPGLYRTVTQDGESSMHFWWLPPTSQNPAPRLLLWDGETVGISDLAGTDQSVVPVKNATDCDQVALAPDNHAFVCAAVGTQG